MWTLNWNEISWSTKMSKTVIKLKLAHKKINNTSTKIKMYNIKMNPNSKYE